MKKDIILLPLITLWENIIVYIDHLTYRYLLKKLLSQGDAVIKNDYLIVTRHGGSVVEIPLTAETRKILKI
jgi:hypothetical protein